ncbi:solute carrier family 23 member 2-like isoform X2 [Rhopalosiphum padi]|uniref:solute carrier family 23 member 2-like isoform X2 n=1 Tax=Rhopalosiphum padi TaxID=40932 RepID=UPI00298EAD24|nr:solute carrier family 23 member 2-like isoform X2 [Rhopalosiphum padi]
MGNGIKWEFDRIQSMAVHQRRQSKQKTPTECGHAHSRCRQSKTKSPQYNYFPVMDVIKVAPDHNNTALEMPFDLEDEPENSEPVDDCLAYAINVNPPSYLTPLLAIQNVVTTLSCLIFVYNILAPKLCILPEDPARADLLATAVMVAGFSTGMQTILGVRLPIVQSSGFVYLFCTLPILELPKWQCNSNIDLFTMGPEARTLEWNLRVRNIQGAMIITGIIQMFLGYSGFIGKSLKYITPLTVVPTMCLIGLSVIEKGVFLMSGNWTTAIITLFLLTLFSQYLRKVVISLPVYSSQGGLFRVRLKIFALFSILLSVGIMWILCFYMTNRNIILPTDPINTESKTGVLRNAPMFRLPYPFQWGRPTFSLTSVLAMLPAIFANIVQSVANYYTCARFSNLTKPPKNAVSRGIGIEGISTIFAGILGTGSGVSSSSENVGNIGITQVCSRNVIGLAACIMIFLSTFTKLIALLITLPDPVLGAMTSVLLVLIGAVALSNLQFINLNSLRNMYILGLSIFFGLAIPKYISTVQGNVTNIKNETANDVVIAYLSSGIFIAGFVGFILDNTIPDDDDAMNSNTYQNPGKEFKTPNNTVDDQVYTISDYLFDKINYFLTFFM